MDNLIDVYTKIKLRLGSEIIVTYYSSYGKKITEQFKLLDIFDLSYICVCNESKLTYLHFFDYDTMIESIKSVGSNVPIYLNPYVSSDIYDGEYINFEHFFNIKRKILGDEDIDFDIVDYKIETYLSGDHFINYDDLFFSEKQKEEFENFFNLLIDELTSYAKRNGMDTKLKKICSGSTSIVYEIGDKIIKIGKPRRNCFIPYFEYLLQPIINRDFEFDGYPMRIEITQKVLALDNTDGCAVFSDDERFNSIVDELNKIIYSIGIKTDDLHAGNVGILLEDNKIHYDGISWDIGNEITTSILNNNNLRILRKGRFVILDLDSLEIVNINKYCAYLRSIGYDEDKILAFRNQYIRIKKK